MVTRARAFATGRVMTSKRSGSGTDQRCLDGVELCSQRVALGDQVLDDLDQAVAGDRLGSAGVQLLRAIYLHRLWLPAHLVWLDVHQVEAKHAGVVVVGWWLRLDVESHD